MMFIAAAPLGAQADASVGLILDIGVAGLVKPPYTALRVRLMRSTGGALKGRLSVKMLESSGRGQFSPGHNFTRDVIFEQDELDKLVEMVVPVTTFNFTGRAVFEKSEGADPSPAERDFNVGVAGSNRPLIAFISPVRVGILGGFLDHDLWEVSEARAPRDWRAWLCFNAVLLNSEGLDNDQYEALASYVAAGGTLILSPLGPASFAPGTPAAELLALGALPAQDVHSLSDFPSLTRALTAHGEGEFVPDRKAPASTPVAELPAVTGGDIRLWQFTHRRLAPAATNDSRSLFSIGRCGGGRLALLHCDIGLAPFSDAQTRLARAPLGHLLGQTLQECRINGMGRSPHNIVLVSGTAEALDIAGTRIPGHQVIVVVIVLYVLAAGIGMSLLARRLRRPELYPAGLLALAVVAVGAALGLGGIVKGMGERVRAVRYVVSDADDLRQGLYAVGCAYAVDAADYRLSLEPNQSPNLRKNFNYGIQTITPESWRLNWHLAGAAGRETQVDVREVARWQNIYFDMTGQRKAGGMHLRTTRFEGGLGFENLGDVELRGCLVVIAGSVTGEARDGLEWHYLPRLNAAGRPEARASIDKSTLIRGGAQELLERWNTEFGAGALAHVAMRRLLALDPDPLLMHHELASAAVALENAGLRPVQGQWLLVGVLPDGALAPQTLGTPAEPGAIQQSCVWCVLGRLEPR